LVLETVVNIGERLLISKNQKKRLPDFPGSLKFLKPLDAYIIKDGRSRWGTKPTSTID